MSAIHISPSFDDLINPATLTGEIKKLCSSVPETVPHAEILDQLIEQFEPLDFEVLAFPQAERLRQELSKAEPGSDKAKEILKQLEGLKLSNRHYLIISIEETLKVAVKNQWDLCKRHEFVYSYNGAFWAEVNKDTLRKFLGEAALKMGVTKFTAKLHLFREELFKQFLSEAYLPTPKSDNNKVLVNLRNGTFEITQFGRKLRHFDRSEFLTYQLPFDYDEEAKAPIFEAYLNRVLPDIERQKVLAEFLGFTFIRHGSKALKEEKALILYGTGANGKSVIYEIVNALIGDDNISSYSLQSLTDNSGYFRAKIANKLLNYASEINGKLEASTFKQLVSGEPVEARLPYGQPFILKHYAKLIFNCNELPKDVEHTNAYFRRFLIIPFDVTIPEHEQDKDLHTKIIENELAGVFNWVLGGLDRLLKQKKFSECKAAREAVEKYKFESDSVQMFLSENDYKPSPVDSMPLKEMYKNYQNYCIESGFKACSLRTFADRLRNSGYQTERKAYGTAINAQRGMMTY